MNTTPDNTTGDPEQRIAELERQLAEREAERDEGLQRETAIAEVLQVINSSPGDLTPVFDAILEKAMRLCGAAFGSLHTYDGERFQTKAHRGIPQAYAEFRARHPPKGFGAVATLVETRKPVQVLDVAALEAYRVGEPGDLFSRLRAMVELGGVRTQGCSTLYTTE